VTDFLGKLLLLIFRIFGASISVFAREVTGYYETRRGNQLIEELKVESKESIDHMTHKHSAHWKYIKEHIPWRIRLRLSRFRGEEQALTWRIKVLAFFYGFDYEISEWILEEYMFTGKIEDRPASTDDWLCAKCGAYNPETALFCKDCGEYK